MDLSRFTIAAYHRVVRAVDTGIALQWRREWGTKGGMRPGRHSAGGGISRGENMEFWNLAASGELTFALQWYLHPLTTPNTSPVLGPRPQLSVLHNSTQSSVYTKKLTLLIWLNIHLLQNCRRSILYSYCFRGNRSLMFCTIHVFPNST